MIRAFFRLGVRMLGAMLLGLMVIRAPAARAIDLDAHDLDASDCRQQPSARNLTRYSLAAWAQLNPSDPLASELQVDLAFEARHFNLTPPSDLPLRTSDSTIVQQQHEQLQMEEQFLHALKQQDFAHATAMLPRLSGPLRDYLASSASALYLEHLILALRDQEAEQFKKQYYETLLNLNDQPRITRMIEVARHEILGGQPGKGRDSLKHIGIDEFSDSESFGEKTAAGSLAAYSEALFLHPSQQLQDCTRNPVAIGHALQFYLGTHQQQQAVDDLANPRLRIRTRLQLAQLHHNSQQCPLLAYWLVAQSIQEICATPVTNPQQIRELVFIARAARRYSLLKISKFH